MVYIPLERIDFFVGVFRRGNKSSVLPWEEKEQSKKRKGIPFRVFDLFFGGKRKINSFGILFLPNICQ